MRWRVWMTLASAVRVGRRPPRRCFSKKLRIETALVVSSAPWSITLKRSSGVRHGGRDLDAAGAPAIRHRHFAAGERDLVARDRQTPFRIARRIIRFVCSSR
jgi:hypothetical protein